MNRAFIYGNGGHARVIASFLNCPFIFLVEGNVTSENEIRQEVFEREDHLFRGDVYIGIGNNKARKRVFEFLKNIGRSPATCVAPNAFVARDSSLDSGALICAGAVIGSRAKIGQNTIVNSLSSVDHDCVLGDHSQVTAGVTIGGGVKIGTNCFFGVKCAVVPNVEVGDNSQVRAGSVVTKSVPQNVLVGGTPARVVRTIE